MIAPSDSSSARPVTGVAAGASLPSSASARSALPPLTTAGSLQRPLAAWDLQEEEWQEGAGGKKALDMQEGARGKKAWQEGVATRRTRPLRSAARPHGRQRRISPRSSRPAPLASPAPRGRAARWCVRPPPPPRGMLLGGVQLGGAELAGAEARAVRAELLGPRPRPSPRRRPLRFVVGGIPSSSTPSPPHASTRAG